jgi:hypothetical protein
VIVDPPLNGSTIEHEERYEVRLPGLSRAREAARDPGQRVHELRRRLPEKRAAGFYLLEVRDLNDAIQMAAKIPPAREGSIEVRPVRELNP